MIFDNKQAEKVAFVSGSGRRIGAAIAKVLHEAGFRVAIHCNQSTLEAELLAHNFNLIRQDSAFVFKEDLLRPNASSQLIKRVFDWALRLDLVVNNASLFLRSDCDKFQAQDWQNLFALNVQAPFELSIAAFPMLALNLGSIINITDIHAKTPLKGYSAYCQSKAALLMQTKSLAKEFAPNVRVNAISPGAIAWPEKNNTLSEKIRQEIIAKTPLKRHGEPEFIAKAVMALVDNPFITGQVLNVDGGRSIG